jgi:naphthoate synthase
MTTSYEKRHGIAPRTEPNWTQVTPVSHSQLKETTYFKDTAEGISRVAINRPSKHNAFTPTTISELIACVNDSQSDPSIGCLLFTGEGGNAFSSGGDQSLRGTHGYSPADQSATSTSSQSLNVLQLQAAIRRMPKPVIALVKGYAVGGGNVLQVVCDLTIAGESARFGQTGPRVGSVDAGYGCAHLARCVGQKKAREMWFLCKLYSAHEAERMGLVNTVVPDEEVDGVGASWAREIMRGAPTTIRLAKAALNTDEDGHAGQMALAGDATYLLYQSDEAHEARSAFSERRAPDFSDFSR